MRERRNREEKRGDRRHETHGVCSAKRKHATKGKRGEKRGKKRGYRRGEESGERREGNREDRKEETEERRRVNR